MTEPAQIFLTDAADEAAGAVLADTLAAYGLAARVATLPPRRNTEALTWLVLAAVPLQSFLTAVGTKAADGSLAALAGTVRKVVMRRAAEPPARPLVLQDSATGLQIVLESGLPDAAYEQLVGLDLTRFTLGPLHYDRAAGRWRSELDEAAAVDT